MGRNTKVFERGCSDSFWLPFIFFHSSDFWNVPLWLCLLSVSTLGFVFSLLLPCRKQKRGELSPSSSCRWHLWFLCFLQLFFSLSCSKERLFQFAECQVIFGVWCVVFFFCFFKRKNWKFKPGRAAIGRSSLSTLLLLWVVGLTGYYEVWPRRTL